MAMKKKKKASEEIKRDMCPKPQKERSRGNKKGHVFGTSKKNGQVPNSRISHSHVSLIDKKRMMEKKKFSKIQWYD